VPARATLLVLALLAAAADACGESAEHHQRYLFAQKCAMCHALDPGRLSPDPRAPNLGRLRPGLEQVRRAIIDGRPGMPKGLAGGSDVDEIAAYVVERTHG
jgi:mono/diheme cytochrome c family protein